MAIKGYYVINTVIKIRKEMTQGKNKTEFHLSMNFQNLKKKKIQGRGINLYEICILFQKYILYQR